MINLGNWRICVYWVGLGGGGGITTADHKKNTFEDDPAFLAVVLFGSTFPNHSVFKVSLYLLHREKKDKERSMVRV
jgi:hypothetical protein